MKKLYSVSVLISFSVIANSQLHYETVGNPATPTPVYSYTEWSDTSATYTGTAEVQSTNPSNYNYASGAGNVFFTNTPGTYFQIGGLPGVHDTGYASITFGMYGYDTSNPTLLNELTLMGSVDSGATWGSLPYHRMFEGFWSPKPWDIFTAYLGQVNNANHLMFRFTQTTSTKTFRIDDIDIQLVFLLPITLNYFTAAANNDKVVLKWKASSGSDKQMFVIEKSLNGEIFSPLQTLMAKGNGEFSYACKDVINNKTFYRLKMINIDGKSSYSNIVALKSSSQVIQAIYPIPAKDMLHVRLNNQTLQTITLSLADATGHQRLKKTLRTLDGTMLYDLNIQGLEAGVYYLTVSTSDKRYTEQIVVTK